MTEYDLRFASPMHRFFIPPDAITGETAVLPDDKAHQIRNVLRMQPGERIILLDNSGDEYLAQLEQVTRDTVTAQILQRQRAAAEPAVSLTVYQSLLKKSNFEWVLQKGTELGVRRFVPLVTRHTIRNERSVSPNKMARWRRILTEAAEQCGRGRVPELMPVAALPDALAHVEANVALMPTVAESARSVRAALSSTAAPGALALFIGPEGGFAPEEREQAWAHDAIPVTLGSRILRAETAAVVAVTLIMETQGQLSP